MNDAGTKQAVQAVMGDVQFWRNDPRSSYDQIERAVMGTDLSRNLVDKLNGRGARALGWARVILTKAADVDQAKQFAANGSLETSAALAAVQDLP